MKKLLQASALCCLSLSAATAVYAGGGEKPAQEHGSNHKKEKASAAHVHKEIHWGYEGTGGPHNWGKIKGEYRNCRYGKFQSPVDLKATIDADLPSLDIQYKPAPLIISNNGHTVRVNYPSGSRMVVDGQVFNLLQLDFRTPSEHRINGKAFEMELQFVHTTEDGRLGVLAVLVEEGSFNPAAQTIWERMPMEKAKPKAYKNVGIDVNGLLPENRSYFRLMGSLTTPPCSEGVNWHVLTQPIQFSAQQITKFKKAFNNNARPVQATNSRLIVKDD